MNQNNWNNNPGDIKPANQINYFMPTNTPVYSLPLHSTPIAVTPPKIASPNTLESGPVRRESQFMKFFKKNSNSSNTAQQGNPPLQQNAPQTSPITVISSDYQQPMLVGMNQPLQQQQQQQFIQQQSNPLIQPIPQQPTQQQLQNQQFVMMQFQQQQQQQQQLQNPQQFIQQQQQPNPLIQPIPPPPPQQQHGVSLITTPIPSQQQQMSIPMQIPLPPPPLNNNNNNMISFINVSPTIVPPKSPLTVIFYIPLQLVGDKDCIGIYQEREIDIQKHITFKKLPNKNERLKSNNINMPIKITFHSPIAGGRFVIKYYDDQMCKIQSEPFVVKVYILFYLFFFFF